MTRPARRWPAPPTSSSQCASPEGGVLGAGDAATGVPSYATASATWYDALGRTVATADYGREDTGVPSEQHYFFYGTTVDRPGWSQRRRPDCRRRRPAEGNGEPSAIPERQQHPKRHRLHRQPDRLRSGPGPADGHGHRQHRQRGQHHPHDHRRGRTDRRDDPELPDRQPGLAAVRLVDLQCRPRHRNGVPIRYRGANGHADGR